MLFLYAKNHKKFRDSTGALRLDLPKTDIKVKDQRVIVSPQIESESREMVSEMMVLAGRVIAQYSIENNISMPYLSQASGKFSDEIIPVEIPQRKGPSVVMTEDEEYKNVKMEKIPSLRAAFSKDGTVTAANASTINDGGAALILMSVEKARELKLSPIAKIKSFADAAHEPKWFTTAPSKAIPKALEKIEMSINEIEYFELNEAFSVVGLANMKILDLKNNRVNVNGGAVSLGHPLGVSGARIIISLISVLKQNKAKIGAAGICNGGGGASAMIIESL